MKPALRDRIGMALAALAAVVAPGIFAQYEAGQRWNPRRSWIPGYVRDARFDADSATRLEMVRKARYFERNSGLVNRLCDLEEQYTTPLKFIPASSDPEWNANASAWLADWFPICDLTSLQHMDTVQSLCARSQGIDGEIFIVETSGRVWANQQSFPRIQLVETHRVETPSDLAPDEKVIDGIRVDDRGRPITYYVREGTDREEKHTPVPAERMVHIFEPARPGMMRGLPRLYPVMNPLHDLDDLKILEMDACKATASTTEIIKTKTGEFSMADFRRVRFLGGGTQGTAAGSSEERSLYYKDVFQGRAKVMRGEDEYQQIPGQRPSAQSTAHWDRLESEVCVGWGISKLLVYPWSLQGTVTRADLDAMATFFRRRSSIIEAGFRHVILYALEWATRNVVQLSDPPADWKRMTVRPPRSVNVDVGRNASALELEYRAGWRTLEEICGELGYDYRDVLRQRAIERKAARELEIEYGLEPGELIGAALEAIKSGQTAEPQMVNA